MGGKKSRKHYAVDERLSKDHKAQVDRMILEGVTYNQLTEIVQGLGYDISRSALARYGRDFLKSVREFRIVEDKCRALLAESGDGLVLDEAVSRLLTAAVFKQMQGTLGPKEIINFMHAVANLQRSSVSREKYKDNQRKELEKRAKKAAENVAKEAKKGGLSDATVEGFYNRIMGIADA